MFKILTSFFLVILLADLSHAIEEYPSCANVLDAGVAGGCLYTPRFDTYKFNSEFGSTLVRYYKNTAGNAPLENIVFIVSPFENPFINIGSLSTSAEGDSIFERGVINHLNQTGLFDPAVGGKQKLKEILESGTDVFVFSWPGYLSSDYIQRKSLSLASYLKELNDYRYSVFNEGVARKYESIIGISLGGVVSRMALLKLEQLDSNFIEVYVSFDSPHYGANIPVGIQNIIPPIPELILGAIEDNEDTVMSSVLRFFDENASVAFGLFSATTGVSVDFDEIEDAKKDMKESILMLSKNNSPAVNQLLLNNMYAYGGRSDELIILHRDLEEQGWPEYSINIAVSNGIGMGKGSFGRRIDSGSGSGAVAFGHENFGYDSPIISFRTFRKTKIDQLFNIKVWPVTEYSYYTNGTIWDITYIYDDIGYPRKEKDRDRSGTVRGSLPIDGAACSYSNVSVDLGVYLNDPEGSFGDIWGGCNLTSYGSLSERDSCLFSGSFVPNIKNTCFIPTASSLGIGSSFNDIYHGPNDMDSPFDLVYTASELEPHLYVSYQSAMVFDSVISGDLDRDGLRHFEEIQKGTDPIRGDTDGDGIPDSLDGINDRKSSSDRIVIDHPSIVSSRIGAGPNRLWAGDLNAAQFCVDSGYLGADSWTMGCGGDEDTFNKFNGYEWVERDSGSKNRCYDIIDTVTCKISMVPDINEPRVIDRNGNKIGIWATLENAFAYCRTEHSQSLDFYTQKCGDDESTFAQYDTDDSDWLPINSGSSNDSCYEVISGITCSD